MHKTYFQVLLLILVLLPALSRAETVSRTSLCSRTESANQFVKEATAICMADIPSQRSRCMRDAEEEYSACGYKAAFTTLSGRYQAQLIFLSLFKNMVAAPNSGAGANAYLRRE